MTPGRAEPVKSETLTGLLSRAASRFTDKVALVADGRAYSFCDLDRLAARLANALRARGVMAGDRVSIYGPNCAQWIIAYHATLRLGACVNPINVMLTPDELRHVLRDCGAVALFATYDRLQSLRDDSMLASMRAVVALGSDSGPGIASFEAFLAEHGETCAPANIAPDALSTICYTSGTTGRPKGAMLSHRAVLMNAQLTALMHGRSSDDTVVTALPLPHVYGNVVMNSALMTGMTLVLHTRFEEQVILESIAKHHATVFDGVPAMYLRLLNHAGLDQTDLTSLRICTVGGQTMSASKMQQVEQRMGCPLIELWGMTEISGLGTTFSHHGPIRHGSIGVVMPYNEVKIADPEAPTRELADDTTGELLIRGPIVMQGYFNNEAATREAIEPDGWLHTGDIARKDSQGYVTIVDRKKDMILTSGYNVYPAEIERVLAEHPQVEMCAVGSITDEIKGELPKAYVVPKAGSAPDADELIDFCRERLAAYKVPRAVQFVPDLPRTSSGKIMRRQLHLLERGSPLKS